MIIADFARIRGRSCSAGRKTQDLVGGAFSIQSKDFLLGSATLDPRGGQVS